RRRGSERDPERSAAVRSALAVGIAVSAYGLSFGALATASGLDVWQTCVLSLFMFSGGSQFAVIGVLATGGLAAAPAAIAGSTLLGARNALYAMRMGPIVGGPWWRRLLAAQWT
ncbi:AzlC family ABC transporter permease, partial [Mesorhizobium japonicum]|uniref:AzlC family ABC transporter permease n=1 Tax=Mesorhizobium japonicum TaxID=2066070 RepID=UPI003B5B1351